MEINITTIAQHANNRVRAEKAKDIRTKHGENTIVLFEVGDFYETYGEGARQMAQAIGVTLTKRGNIEESAFPVKAEATYFPRLVREGYKLCIYEKGQY